jgi:hypothetical protein
MRVAAIAVPISLIGIRIKATVVAYIAHAVLVLVNLVGIGKDKAVVVTRDWHNLPDACKVSDDAAAVAIVQDAVVVVVGITDVTDAIGLVIFLAGIRDVGTVVVGIGDAVTVGVAAGRVELTVRIITVYETIAVVVC